MLSTQYNMQFLCIHVPSSQHEILQRQCSLEVHQQAESVRGERDGV